MSTLLGSLRATGFALARGSVEPRFYLALLLGLVLWVLAYQNKQDYVVKIADLSYRPYISNFNDIEKPTGQPPYRWSEANPRIFLPGIGNEPVQVSVTTFGGRPGGPPPAITLSARGQNFSIQTQPEDRTDTFLFPRGNPWDGDFTLDMAVPAFTPANDPRELGVIIREVIVRPADYSLRPVVVPAMGTVAFLLVGVTASYLFGLVIARDRTVALIFASASILLSFAGILAARPDTGLLAGQLPSLWAWGLFFALLARTLLDVVVPRGANWSRFVVAAGSASFALAFMVRFGGLTNAQFLTSDLFLHIHNTESVLRGEWLFTEPVPDGTLVPYPPAHYVLVSILSWFVGNSEEVLGLLLKWSASLLDAAPCLAMAWAGWRLAPGAFGGLCALVYACSPSAFDLFSAGNYTNIFAQSTLNLTLLGALVFLSRPARPSGPLLLAAGFGLTMLGHYGMMLGTLAVLLFFAIWTGVSRARHMPTGNAVWLLGSALVALAVSIALYYSHFTVEISAQWTGLAKKLLGKRTAPPAAQAPGAEGYFSALSTLPARIFKLLGGQVAVTALFGAMTVVRLSAPARALLASWLLAVALFALLDQVVGDSVRWYYLGAVPVSLLAGSFLVNLMARGARARALGALLMAAMALYMIVFWMTLIYTRYH